MSKIDQILEKMNVNPANIKFSDLCKVCEHYFGKPRQSATSHCVYKTPWLGDPRVNIQNKKGKAKSCQAKQVLKAILDSTARYIVKHYSYRTIWSPEDQEYVGLCTEFPSLSWLAESPEQALAGIHKLVTEVISDMTASGEELPDALGDKTYSEKFMVQVPPEVHRELSIQAAEQGGQS